MARSRVTSLLSCAAIAFAWTGCSEGESEGSGGGGASAGGDTSTSGGRSGSGGMGGRQSEQQTQCPSPIDVPVEDLEWEHLPSLAEGPDAGASQSSVFVGASGDIYVGASFFTGLFSAPKRLEVHRFESGAWNTVGDEPVSAGGGLVLGMAEEQGRLIAAIVVEGDRLLRREAADGWETLALPDEVAAEEIVTLQGRSSAWLLSDGGDAGYRVHTWQDGNWSQRGANLIPGGNVTWNFPFSWQWLEVNCDGSAAVIIDGSAFWFDGSDWSNLGNFSVTDSVEFPSVGAAPGRLTTSYSASESPIRVTDYDFQDESFAELGMGVQRSDAVTPRYSASAVDNSGLPFVAYREDQIYVDVWTGDSWQPFIAGDAPSVPTGGGTIPDLALTADGLPVVVWENVDDDDSLLGIARAVAL